MLRRFSAGVAVVALLYGFSVAPYTHAHHAIDAVSDERHPHGQTLVHTHATPHAHHDAQRSESQASGTHDDAERIWSVDGFVFQQPVPSRAPAPVLLVFGEPPLGLTSVWLGAQRPQPKAHAPPFAWTSPVRAPPVVPPSFA